MDTAKNIEIFDGIEWRGEVEQKPTADLRLCWACSANLRDHDKFCRRCGARQTGEMAPQRVNTGLSVSGTTHLRGDTVHSVSASLLTGIAAGAQAGMAQFDSRCARGTVSALILIPLWLMIVLLSPFDAYATARAFVGQHQTPYRNFGD